MADHVHIDIDVPKDPTLRPRCQVEVGSEHNGRNATFQLIRKVDVHDRRAVNRDETLFEHSFRVRSGHVETFELPGRDAHAYSYKGPHMDIQLLCRVVVDDGYLWDTTVDRAFDQQPFDSPRGGSCARHLESPEDQYEFFANLDALPAGRRMLAGLLAIGGGGGLAAFCFVSLHDTLVASRNALVFTYRDGPPPLFLAFFVGIFGAIFLYFSLRKLMGGYVTLTEAKIPGKLGRDDALAVGDFFRARAETDLNDLTVRIIACNQEKGQYRRGSGTNTRTVSFSHPTRGVVLFERRLGFLRAGRDIDSELREPLDLTPMFDGLYPPQMVGSQHGMDVHFEVQLIHDKYVDRELVLPSELFLWEDFLEDRGGDSW
jgi:hypothetical protein